MSRGPTDPGSKGGSLLMSSQLQRLVSERREAEGPERAFLPSPPHPGPAPQRPQPSEASGLAQDNCGGCRKLGRR